MSAGHKHEFTALWAHFGPYGDETGHYHVCFDYDCDRVLIGPGRSCDGNAKTHHRKTLTDQPDSSVPVAAQPKGEQT